jgi:hypothetical protein
MAVGTVVLAFILLFAKEGLFGGWTYEVVAYYAMISKA